MRTRTARPLCTSIRGNSVTSIMGNNVPCIGGNNVPCIEGNNVTYIMECRIIVRRCVALCCDGVSHYAVPVRRIMLRHRLFCVFVHTPQTSRHCAPVTRFAAWQILAFCSIELIPMIRLMQNAHYAVRFLQQLNLWIKIIRQKVPLLPPQNRQLMYTVNPIRPCTTDVHSVVRVSYIMLYDWRAFCCTSVVHYAVQVYAKRKLAAVR